MSLNPLERKAALALKPYFSKNPIVVDVGSNKGFWADILINNVEEMHLIEPNERLLTYTMVKYDHLTNVKYKAVAISNANGQADFQYFTDTHNGLSNIIANPKWQYLVPKTERVETATIDSLFAGSIDFLKIDIEGADFMALQGAKKALSDKRIKFIQIEIGEHYDFSPVRGFVQQFGYDVFDFDGERFTKWQGDRPENVYIMDKDFTQDWNKEFIKNTQLLKGKVQFALEIGAFEGLTSTYICDHLLIPNTDARMIAVDPLTDEYLPGHEDNALFVGQYERFVRNTRNYPVELLRMTSDEAFKIPAFEHYRFDLIYIDGDHREAQVYLDGVNAFQACRVSGYILFDDYEWRDETKRGIDRFLNEYKKFIEIIEHGYQVMVRKTQNRE